MDSRTFGTDHGNDRAVPGYIWHFRARGDQKIRGFIKGLLGGSMD